MDTEQLQADMAKMKEFETEQKTLPEEEEQEDLNYYLNIISPERQASTTEEKMEFIKGLLTM